MSRSQNPLNFCEEQLSPLLYVFIKFLTDFSRTKRTLPSCGNALLDYGLWTTQILSKLPLKGPSYLWWNPKEKAEVANFWASLWYNASSCHCCFCVLLTMTHHSFSGNNIYGDDVRENLLRLQKQGTEEDAAYILMQRIFPTVSPTFLVRDGICHKDHAISELGVYGAYLRYITCALKDCNLLHLVEFWFVT